MIPVVCIVGRSGSGKTTLLEALLPELQRRGYVVAAIKDCRHGFVMDHEGKDTWRLYRAGAQHVLLTDPTQTGLVTRLDQGNALDDLIGRLIPDCDVVIAEGFKTAAAPKIELVRAACSSEPVCAGDPLLIGLISDVPGLDLGVPRLGLDDTAGLAALIERELILPARRELLMDLRVDGKKVELKPFVRKMIAGALLGQLDALTDATGRRVSLRLRLPEKD